MPSMEYLMLRSARRARLQARVTVMQPFEKFLHMLKPRNVSEAGSPASETFLVTRI